MKSMELLDSWKIELKKISNDIIFKIDINFENTDDEEFYFFIDICEKIIPYGFYDDCGYGIGLAFKNKNKSIGYYFKELGLSNNIERILLEILIDIVKGEKMFVELEKNNFSIDFQKYIGKENLPGFSNCKRLSIYDINKTYAL
jgi:hypothetical protein